MDWMNGLAECAIEDAALLDLSYAQRALEDDCNYGLWCVINAMEEHYSLYFSEFLYALRGY